MATNTRKHIRKSHSEANPEPSSMAPKKGKMIKQARKRGDSVLFKTDKPSGPNVHHMMLFLHWY